MTPVQHQLVRILLAGFGDIEEWRLGDPALAAAKGYPREYPAEVIDDEGIVFVDIVREARTGRLVCHEVNGPNAVGSDALTGDSTLRAASEVRQTVRRARDSGCLDAAGRINTPVATVHAHQHWKAFRTGGEFYPRVDQFADLLAAALPGNSLCRRGAADPLGSEQVAVVMGDVPGVAAHLNVDPDTRRFEYRGRPVIFAGNPNLLPELVRTRKLPPEELRAASVDLRPFHAWRLMHVVHDKALQQQLLRGTGIQPLRHFAAPSAEVALGRCRELLDHGPVVLKPNAASGGTGVHVVAPGMTDREIRARIDAVIADCVAKYGENAESTAFPVRGFEFVRSTGYPLPDGEHLWDLRIAVLFEPGRAQVFPVSLRLAPQPFDEHTFHRDRDQWVSNVSGRRNTLLKSGMDDEALAAVGLTEERLEEAFRACLRWTLKAWDGSIRDGGGRSPVYEDECEARDPQFYPWHKFSASASASAVP
jgi:hypothetical protein